MVIYETAKICPRTKLNIHEGTMIGDFSFICCGELVMECGAQINRYVEVSGRGKVEIGEYSTVASHATILTSTDTPQGIMNDLIGDEYRLVYTRDVRIGKRCFIGNHVTIMPGITIGDDSIIRPYSFVNRPIPSGVIWGGVDDAIKREYHPAILQGIRGRWP